MYEADLLVKREPKVVGIGDERFRPCTADTGLMRDARTLFLRERVRHSKKVRHVRAVSTLVPDVQLGRNSSCQYDSTPSAHLTYAPTWSVRSNT